jgi:apolipoprotein N-acyltransferase
LASTVLMLVVTAVLLPLLFPPFYCFFLAPVALVPFCVCVIRRPLWWRYIGAYYLLGVACFVPNLFWLGSVTIGGYIALGLFVALYFALFAVALHRLVVEFRLPATFAVPLAWTAVEYMRSSFLEGGFPWFILGNCLAPVAVLIQTADLFGVWGLTFLIAMMNGFVVDLLRLPLRPGGRFNPAIGRLLAVVAVALAFAAGYGVFRLSQNTTHAGPRVAVLQENFEQRVKDDPKNAGRVLLNHLALARQAAAETPRPDLIGWPETMVTGWVNDEFLNAPIEAFKGFEPDASPAELEKAVKDRQQEGRDVREILQDVCDGSGATQLIGYGALEPRGTFSASIKQNRTGIMVPGGKGRIVEEYAKVHLVPFGEYIPFRGLPVVGKYMIYLTPYGVDYSNQPGDRWTRFVMRVPASAATTAPGGEGSREYTFGTPICFEDTMPYPCRFMTAPRVDSRTGQALKKADFLLNVSNDGWFHWVELDQHLQACQMRAVENRVSIARSVNTGNSGFIDSNGRIMGLVTGPNGSSLKAVGTLAMNVPIDSRTTLFSHIGDLLPIVCGIGTTLLVGWTVVRPRRGPRATEAGGDAGAADSAHPEG